MHLTCSTHASQCTLSVCRFSVGARGAGRAQSIRVPLDSLRTAAELISSAVDYGVEEVDPEMSVENVQVVYVDRSGRTKPVASKTSLSLLKKARKVCISPIGLPLRTASVEKVRPSVMPVWLCSALPCARSVHAAAGSTIWRQGAQEDSEEGSNNTTRSQAAEAKK